MRILILFLILLSWACSPKSQSGEQAPAQLEEQSFPKIQVRFSDLREVEPSSMETVPENLTAGFLQCMSWTDQNVGVFVYRRIPSSQSFIAFVSSIRGEAFYFVNVSGESSVLDCILLVEDRCDLLEQTDDYELIACDVTQSVFEGNRLTIISTHSEEFDYGDRKEGMQDSIMLNYQMVANEQLKFISKDSIRIQ